MTDLWVDPSTLRQAGTSLLDSAEHLANQPPGGQATVVPAGDQPGWLAWPAMLNAGRAWCAELSSISGGLATQGGSVVAAAQTYTTVDVTSAGAILATGL